MTPLSVLVDLLGSADFLRVQLAPLADPDPREAAETFRLVAEGVDPEPAARAVLKRLEDAGFSIS
jgi:hypothetical protein